MSIAENIRRIRTQHDMTQEEFGKVAAVSAMAVSQWENGRAVPRMGAVQRIADYFNISKGEVIDEEAGGAVLPSGAIPVVASSATVPLLTLGRVHAGLLADEEEVAHRVEVPASVYTVEQARDAVLAALERKQTDPSQQSPRQDGVRLPGEGKKEPADMTFSAPLAEDELEQAPSEEGGAV